MTLEWWNDIGTSLEWLLNDGMTSEWQNDFRMMGWHRMSLEWLLNDRMTFEWQNDFRMTLEWCDDIGMS